MHRILILGAADVGKSSFARFLARTLLAAGRSVALVDGDLGQKDVGPPACITLGYAGPEGLWQLADCGCAFVGDTSPPHRMAEFLDALARLTRRASDADAVLVNTGGLVAGPGRRLKPLEIDVVAPDAILAIARGDELDSILASRPAAARPVLRLAPAPSARRKSRGERTGRRREAFAAYFAAGRERSFAAAIVRPPLDRLEGGLPALIGRLCGIVDAAGGDAGMALVTGVDPAAGRLTVLSPAACGRVGELRLGDLRIAPDGRELGRNRAIGPAVSGPRESAG